MFGLIRSITTFFKCPGSQHECRPIYGLNFVFRVVCDPLYKKGGFGGPNFCNHESLAVLAIKMADFF